MNLRKLLRKPLASLLKRYYILSNDGYSIGRAYGTRLLFDWRHSLDKKVAVELYEHPQISYLTRCVDALQPQMFIDIGAHAALYSLILKARHPQLEVHAFEPDRTNLCQLYANLFINGLTRSIHVHEHGISDRSGHATFETADETSSRGTRRISHSGNSQIPVHRLDDVIKVRDQTLTIKIDVEGHELQVLEGAREVLSHNNCLLQIESAPDQFAAVLALLKSIGYNHMITINDHFFCNIDHLLQSQPYCDA